MPLGVQPVNPYGTEFRPDTTYIWIPDDSVPGHIVPGITSNSVVCGYPLYPPNYLTEILVNHNKPIKSKTMENQKLLATNNLLDSILATAKNDQSSFQDKDGLISFVNLSSSFVQNNEEFKIGQTTCDKVSNFIATLRAFTAIPLHACCGVIMGYYFGLYIFKDRNRLNLFKSLFLAIAFHASYNYFATRNVLLMFFVLVVLIMFARKLHKLLKAEQLSKQN